VFGGIYWEEEEMFGFCEDQFTRELRKRGYCLVPLAEESIHAREIVGRQGSALFRFGDLATLFESESPIPDVKQDIKAQPIDVTETGGIEGRLGAMIVARWLGGDKAGLTGRLKNNKKFKLKISEIRKEQVDLSALDAFLAKAQTCIEAPTIVRLMAADAVYVITAVLKAPSMMLESQSGELIGADLAVTEVHSGISGSVKAKGEGRGTSRIVFKADAPVAFAFQAAKLLYRNGRYSHLEPDLGPLNLMGEKEDKSAEPRLVDEIGVGMISFDR
jgi:hypothetical protein